MTNLSGLEIIGYFCWWSINDVKVHREALQKLLDDLGIDYKIPEPHLRSAFLKAVREVKAGNKKNLLIRKISKGSDSYVFGLVDEKVDIANKHLGYTHNATLTFSPITGTLTVDSPHRAFEIIKAKYDEFKDYLNADDVRTLLLKIMATLRSVSVRQRGGIYFIPQADVSMVEKLEKLLPVIPGSNDFLVAPQIDTERSKRAIYKAFVESLKNRMADFEKDLDADGGLQRKSAIIDRLNEFKTIKGEIEFYKEALSFQVEGLATALDDLTKKFTKKLEE